MRTRSVIAAAAAVAGLAGCGSAPPASAPPAGAAAAPPPTADGPSAPAEPPRSPEQQRNLESFDYVWQTVRDKHFDPTLGGLDWNAVRAELRPRVEAAADRAAARAALEEMLARLGQSHFGIIPADAYRALEGADDGEPPPPDPAGSAGTVGLTIRVAGDQAVVLEVADGSPAAGAGVRPGWILTRINGADLAPILAEVKQGLPDEALAPAMLASAVHQRLDGATTARVAVVLLDGRDRPVQLELARTPPRGQPVVLGNLPPFLLRYESRRIGKDVGYIAFSAFLDPATIMRSFTTDIRAFADTRGVILDLRGNPGGLGAMAMGIGGWFVTEPNQSLGTMITRDARLDFVLNPQDQVYPGKVAILVDELSMSTSEILAAGLQDLGRAKVFGRRSPGAALPSVIERLPNGDGFQYAFATYVSSGGRTLEGHGVVPDFPIPIDRKALLGGKDPVLEAAVAWIRAKR